MEILNSCLGVVERAFNMPVFYFVYLVRPPIFGCFFIVLCLVKDFLKVSKGLCLYPHFQEKRVCVCAYARTCVHARTHMLG